MTDLLMRWPDPIDQAVAASLRSYTKPVSSAAFALPTRVRDVAPRIGEGADGNRPSLVLGEHLRR